MASLDSADVVAFIEQKYRERLAVHLGVTPTHYWPEDVKICEVVDYFQEYLRDRGLAIVNRAESPAAEPARPAKAAARR